MSTCPPPNPVYWSLAGKEEAESMLQKRVVGEKIGLKVLGERDRVGRQSGVQPSLRTYLFISPLDCGKKT